MKKPVLEMTFDINILEHLGLRMYTSLPAVVAEFVANSWDAGATNVAVKVPKAQTVSPDYAVSIEDNGCGMTANEVNKKFLVVGRARREEEGTDKITVRGRERTVIGRKGIGKLAGFGVAGEVEVTSRQQGQFVTFAMDYDAMKTAARKAETKRVKAQYTPEVKAWGPTREDDGTVVRLRRLKRVEIPDVDLMRRHLARRFSILGPSYNFEVSVNGAPITPAERARQEMSVHLADR